MHIHWIKKWNPTTGLSDKQFEEIKQAIHKEWPVCGGFRWPNAPQWKEGVLQMAPPQGVFDGHSVLLVGYRDDPKLPGGGVFILRNSNTDRDDGLMCYEYARAYLNDALWIESDKKQKASAKK
jgi:C1A family cysteine protease